MRLGKTGEAGASNGDLGQSNSGRQRGEGLGAPERLLDYGSDAFEEEDASDSSLSEDSDLEYNWMNKSSSKDRGPTTGFVGPFESSRRGSIVMERASPDSLAQERGRNRFIESQYNSALNYPLDFLSDMLTPQRSAGNCKFEICVDELIFVGHPVFNNPDGKWEYPADPDEDGSVGPTARGRRARKEPSNLGTVKEGEEASSSESDDSGEPEPQLMQSEGDDDPPMLNMFQLVLILDKADPKYGAQLRDGLATMTPFDEVHREIVFKWTAAALALQVQDGYIAREAGEMAKMREKAINDGGPKTFHL